MSDTIINIDALCCGAISGTYAQLETLKNASQLKVGKYYLHTDYVCIYDIPDYEEIGGNILPKTTIVTRTHDVVEPLLLLAVTTSEFYLVAISTLHPSHYIEFDFNYNSTYVNNALAKGKITYRECHLKNASNCDHLGVRLWAYNHNDGKGYFHYFDNGNTDRELVGARNLNSLSIRSNKLDKDLWAFVGLPFDIPNIVAFGFSGSWTVGDTSNVRAEGFENSFIEFNNIESDDFTFCQFGNGNTINANILTDVKGLFSNYNLKGNVIRNLFITNNGFLFGLIDFTGGIVIENTTSKTLIQDGNNTLRLGFHDGTNYIYTTNLLI